MLDRIVNADKSGAFLGNSELSGDGNQLSVLTIALDRETDALLKLWLPTANISKIADYPESGFLADALKSDFDACLIDFDRVRSKAVSVAERIHQDSPDVAICAFSSDSRSDVIIQAMRSGCQEYLFKPLVRDDFLQAITRTGGRRRDRKDRSNAQVLTFVGAKGGCGVTTLATQLGALLASYRSKKTLLLDLHPSLGDAGLYLGFTSNPYHAYELMENTERLDTALLQSFSLHHSSGLDVLPAPNDFENTRHLSMTAVSNAFSFLRLCYDFIIVDLPPGLNDQSAKLIGVSDFVYLVTVAEVSALRNCSRIVDYMIQEEIPDDRVRVILNRFEKRSPIPEAQIEKVMQRKIYWAVPNQYQEAMKTITSGDFSANLSRSELIRNIKGWADLVAPSSGEADNKVTKKKRGLLGALLEAN